MQQPQVVRCPACCLVLEVPVGATRFRCPCGLVLNAPKQQQQQQQQQSQQQSHQQHLQQSSSQIIERDPNVPTNDDEFQINLKKRQHSIVGDSPPVETLDSARDDCELCLNRFTLLNRRHHCRSCGALVCRSCSQTRWPANMLPPSHNSRNEKVLRICSKCSCSNDRFRNALLNGDLTSAMKEYSSGHIRLSCSYSIYPNQMFPIHVAATSGSIPCVQWLIAQGCFVGVTDGRGFTVLACAAQKGNLDLVRYLVSKNYSKIEEVTDRYALQNLLTFALEKLDDNSSASLPPPPSYFSQVVSAPPPKPPTSSSSSSSSSSCSSAPVPKDSDEEEEQMRIALAASKSLIPPPPVPPPRSTSSSNINTTSIVQCSEPNISSVGECIICFDAPIQTCFTPCGHSCACAECAKGFKECPVCRGKIEQTIRTYAVSSS